MDRSEWVLVLEQLNAFLQNHEHGDECPFWLMAGTDLDCTCGLQEARTLAANTLAAAPPPPAEQASGEHLETLREIRLAYGDAPNHFTAEKAALDHAIAALSQRPVVSDEVIERACANAWGEMTESEKRKWWEYYPDDPDDLRDMMRRGLTAALAPQQPEKGEGA